MEPKTFRRTFVTERLEPTANSCDNVNLSQLIVELCVSVFVRSANCIVPRSLLTILQNNAVMFLKKKELCFRNSVGSTAPPAPVRLYFDG